MELQRELLVASYITIIIIVIHCTAVQAENFYERGKKLCEYVRMAFSDF